MARINDDDWVSEPGTSTVMSVAREPHSINDMASKQRNTRPERETRVTKQAGDEVPNKQSKEPTESADQKDAAMSAMSDRLSASMPVEGQTLVYIGVATLALLIVNEVM